MAKDLEFFKTVLNGLTHKIDSDRTWDKLKDKPFYSTTEQVDTVVLDEMSAEIHEDNEYWAQLETSFVFDVGTTYKVTFDGVAYECVAYEMWEATVIGNGSIAGGEGGNGEPFFFVGEHSIVYANSEGAHTFSITQTKIIEETRTIDPKYLPDVGGVKYVNVAKEWDEVSDDWSYTPDASYADIRAWIDAGVEVKCLCDSEVYDLSIVHPDPTTIQHIGLANQVGFCRVDSDFIKMIGILENGEILHYREGIVRRDTVQTMINESLGVIENGTY